MVPDLPWIAKRAIDSLAPGVDPIDLRLYVVIQSTLVGSLLLCGALAMVSQAPRKIFAILSLNALLHLLLDALQTKWGNGVHLLAPVSWRMWNLGLFWPESSLAIGLTVVGLGVVGWGFWSGFERPVGLCVDRPARLFAAITLIAAYLAFPWVLLADAEASDTHFLGTTRSRASRAGREIAVDRAEFVLDQRGPRLTLYNREQVAVTGRIPSRSAVVSVRGRFRDRGTLVIEEFHTHAGRLRDLGSYIGLGLVALAWLLPMRRLSARASASN